MSKQTEPFIVRDGWVSLYQSSIPVADVTMVEITGRVITVNYAKAGTAFGGKSITTIGEAHDADAIFAKLVADLRANKGARS